MFTLAEIIRATGGSKIGAGELHVAGVTTDSRTATADDLFIALSGERFDGHDFVAKAAERGVCAFLLNKEWAARNSLPAGVVAVVVPDTLRALGDLAAWHRQRFTLPVVGVTGSNGKTTVKEMLAAIMVLTGPGLKTSGNLNNLIGLPQMLFKLTARDRWAVLEMGMSELGEIDRLAEMAAPRVGIITNAFPAHLESMGSVEAVARAKGELFLRLPTGGCAVYNADDPLIAQCPAPHGVDRLSFGLRGAEVSTESIRSHGRDGQSFVLRLPVADIPIRLRVCGRHNIYNALAAAAAAHALGVEPDLIRAGLEGFTPYARRFSLEDVAGVVLIDDSYNANPASMTAALTTLRDIREECRAIAVLGDMLELGSISPEAHRELGLLAAACVDRLYLLGEMATIVADGAVAGGLAPDRIFRAENHGEIIADLQSRLTKGDYLLVKGSRGMRMDVVAEAVRRGFAPAGMTEGVA
jgi:UDP-N-acetylmuramoyl-tripeptide--D-alanyl-D-alanine ligase